MGTSKGTMVYMLYRALTYGLSPFLHLHLRWRGFHGFHRWPERLGHASLPRPPGPLLWFHAVSLGEGMATIPVIKQCLQQRSNINILMTTTTISAFEVIKDQLPTGVLYQFAPLDTPAAIDAFLVHWKPSAIILMESELWPNLIVRASNNGIELALLNARISAKSFSRWSSSPLFLPLISLMLSRFSLIVPLNNFQAISFQLLHASPSVINFSGDLKYAAAEIDVSKEVSGIKDLKLQFSNMKVWMASSIHRGEEKVILKVHRYLMEVHTDIVTIIAPRDPQHGHEIFQELMQAGDNVALRSQSGTLLSGSGIYVVDTLGELRYLYRLTPIAVVGGSFIPGLAGHNISEAAAAGCAVLTGTHVGHYSHMVLEMQKRNPLSVLQVSGTNELAKVLNKFFSDAKVLEAHQLAARQAFSALSSGIVSVTWNLLMHHVLQKCVA